MRATWKSIWLAAWYSSSPSQRMCEGSRVGLGLGVTVGVGVGLGSPGVVAVGLGGSTPQRRTNPR